MVKPLAALAVCASISFAVVSFVLTYSFAASILLLRPSRLIVLFFISKNSIMGISKWAIYLHII